MMNHRTFLLLACSWLFAEAAHPQNLPGKVHAGLNRMKADTSMRYAIVSLQVINAATGALVFAENPDVGLAPASCQKLFTSVAALDLLGPDYRYRTELGYDGKLENGVLTGNIYIVGSGDPSLGSWRYDSTREDTILGRWVKAVAGAGIREFNGDIIVDDSLGGTQPLPRGWISEDIGNYYGAGAWGLNWHENQFDLHLRPGKSVGDPVTIVKPAEELEFSELINECRTGPGGSGDNAYIYSTPYEGFAFVRGTIPLQEEDFVISGSIPAPPRYAGILLGERLKKEGMVKHAGEVMTPLGLLLEHRNMSHPSVILDAYLSPRLDSINYWFLKKSINLYGEALVKSLAYEKAGAIGTDKGVQVVRDFWIAHGIAGGEMHMQDGSGLSPQNRVTTHALVRVLQYARSRPWFHAFYAALPEINGMHMKSGAIGGARSYAGYQRSADGNEYIFSFIVNNYDGPPAGVTRKMFAVLDLLK